MPHRNPFVSDQTTQNHSLLELRNIRKSFGPVVALDGVDFTLAPAAVVALLGESGAGR